MTDSKNIKQTLVWPDQVRAIATVSVILLHVAAPLLYQYRKIEISDWWIANSIDSAMRFCVPVFMMLTGALLLSKNEPATLFYKKRFSRLVYPFVLWTILYLWYNFNPKVTKDFNLIYVWEQLKNGTSYHLWYVYMIVFYYVLIPYLRKWIQVLSNQKIILILIIWFVLLMISLSYFQTLKSRINGLYFIGFIGYPILGYFISHRMNLKINSYKLALLIVLGWLVTAIGTYYFTQKSGYFKGDFYHYLSPNVLLMSVGIFLLVKQISIKSNGLNTVIKMISTYSFGIYLSHVLVLSLLKEWGITGQWIHPLWGIPVTTLMGMVLSISLIFAIKKLPFGNYISG